MNEIKPVMNGDEATYSSPTHEMSFSIRAPAGRTIKGMTFRRTADGGIRVVCQTRPASEFTREDVEDLRFLVDESEYADRTGGLCCVDGDMARSLADRIEAQLEGK